VCEVKPSVFWQEARERDELFVGVCAKNVEGAVLFLDLDLQQRPRCAPDSCRTLWGSASTWTKDEGRLLMILSPLRTWILSSFATPKMVTTMFTDGREDEMMSTNRR